eukprot:CAMPEP_0176072800 /NCGR_PEP_ID=MMETSP0120_2-20121206/36372_1 /TAXON_ID=160619 /ORGANISM="Kryptoperidinium foliaceum, Strain CCMP 1326" /LENGTH=609 /DNA_ID=CAMNT_0017406477 /DNA_START=61 /DNA_END=1888 /DNA_ORIENTATION=-
MTSPCSPPSATGALVGLGSLGSGQVGGGGLRKSSSAASLTSRGTSSLFSGSAAFTGIASLPQQLDPIHERKGPGPRRFSSRHVPSVAEDIAYFELLTPSMHTRFNGLMKYLKNNSAQEDSEKRVLIAESPEQLVPPGSVRALNEEFERRCAYGERMNLELMSSAKWMRLLEDMHLIPPAKRGSPGDAENKSESPVADAMVAPTVAVTPPQFEAEALEGKKAKRSTSPDDDSSVATEAPPSEPDWFAEERTLPRATGDIIFRRVLHNCNHGGLRLDYELFCKALMLTGHMLWPEESLERVCAHMVSKVVETAPEQGSRSPVDDTSELMLTAEAALMLERFKPALHDLFQATCTQNLINPGAATYGAGSVRNQGRSIRKAAPTEGLGLASFGLAGSAAATVTADLLAQAAVGASPVRSEGTPASSNHLALPVGNRWACAETIGRTFAALSGSPRSPRASPVGSASPKIVGGMCKTANGSPVMANRRQVVSSDQFQTLTRKLGVMPDLLSSKEVVRIFKRSETAAAGISHSAGVHGFLTREAFVDAMGSLAIEAYSKPPFCDEYPEVHDKIHALLSTVLPSNTRHTNDRFLLAAVGEQQGRMYSRSNHDTTS